MGENNELTLEEGFVKFISLKRAMNITNQSLKYYENCFKYFITFLGKDIPCKDVDEDSVYPYMLHMRDTKATLSDITRNSYIRGLRVILYYFMEKGYIKKFSIKIPKAQKKIKETYTEDELERLLKKPNVKKCSFVEYRDWVIICYLLATGNRLRTVCIYSFMQQIYVYAPKFVNDIFCKLLIKIIQSMSMIRVVIIIGVKYSWYN